MGMTSFFVVLLLSYLCHAEVLHLDEDNFDQMTSTGLWYLEFHAPWCESCKKFALLYEQASYDEDIKHIKFGAIDASTQRELAKKFSISRFPYITFYENGEEYRYSGSLSLEGLREEGVKMSQPVIKNLTIETFNEFHDRYTVSFLYIINDKNSNINADQKREIFKMAAMKFRPSIPFYCVTYLQFEKFLNNSDFMINSLGFDKNAIENRYNHDTGSTLFAITQSTNNKEISGIILSKDDIEEFIEENRYPPIIQLKLGNYKDLIDNTKYFGIIFVDGTNLNHTKSKKMIDNAETLMINNKEWNMEAFMQYKRWKFLSVNILHNDDESDKVPMYKLLMAWCDFIEYDEWIKHQFGIDMEELPVMLVYSPKEDGYWKYDVDRYNNNMLRFLNDIFDDKLGIIYSKHWIVRGLMKAGKWYYNLTQWQIALLFTSVLLFLFFINMLWEKYCSSTQQDIVHQHRD